MRNSGETTWLQRNTRWLVLGAVGGGLLLLGGLVFVIFMIVATAVRSSDVYQTSVARAQNDSRVLELLGAPVHPGLLVSGSIRVENRNGDADLSIPLSGPRGDAKLTVVAEKRGAEWRYEMMQVQAGDAESGTIDLLHENERTRSGKNEK